MSRARIPFQSDHLIGPDWNGAGNTRIGRLQAGSDIKTIQQLPEHRDVSTTIAYPHVLDACAVRIGVRSTDWPGSALYGTINLDGSLALDA